VEPTLNVATRRAAALKAARDAEIKKRPVYTPVQFCDVVKNRVPLQTDKATTTTTTTTTTETMAATTKTVHDDDTVTCGACKEGFVSVVAGYQPRCVFDGCTKARVARCEKLGCASCAAPYPQCGGVCPGDVPDVESPSAPALPYVFYGVLATAVVLAIAYVIRRRRRRAFYAGSMDVEFI
jgi:hypothetical protein